jgi:quercetin dioxygenase-like cupin family protein
MKIQENIKLIRSAATGPVTVIVFNILPGEKTPWHYHTLFSEAFEVLNGTLEVGLNDQIKQLKQADQVTIKPNEKHYFNNISDRDCLIRVTVSPGNQNFENALLISKGLAKDGLASAAGTPKKLSDLALFVWLNNSKMVGIQKVAAPLFSYLAKRAIEKGRLKQLIRTYGKQEHN